MADMNPQLMRALDQLDQLHRHYLDIRYEVERLADEKLGAQEPEQVGLWAQKVANLYDLLGQPAPEVLRPIRIGRDLERVLAEQDELRREREELS